MLLVLVSGMRGAGKSLFGEVASELSIPCFEMNQPVVDLLLKTDVLITNYSLREFSDALRKEKGADAIAKMTAAKFKKEAPGAPLVILLGIRSPAEIDYFISQNFEVKTVAILADEKTRFSRVLARSRPEDAKTLPDFQWADRLELGWGLAEVLEKSEFKLENSGTKEQAKGKIRSFLKPLVK